MVDFTRSAFNQNRRRDELLKVAEQAAAWLIELEEGGARERAAFAAWLEESPLHVEMFLRASSVDRLTELMAPEDVRALSQKTWGDEATGNVIELARKDSESPPYSAGPTPASSLPEARAFPFRRRGVFSRIQRGILGVAAGVLALVAGGAWYELMGPGAWDSYRTQVGEQRVVQLPDGSLISVNTDSRIEVRYTEGARDVRLREGEALFKVERDPSRPFRVHVGDTVVQAVGTQFNIYPRSNQTKVAVVEGVVQVSRIEESSDAAPAATAMAMSSDEERAAVRPSTGTERLTAGQGLQLREDGSATVTAPVAVNVAQVTAWQQRRLIFERQTLEDIAAEFNRYNRSPQIRVEGEDVRARRYTAVFDADNPQTLLRFLAKDNDLKFSAEGDDFVIEAR